MTGTFGITAPAQPTTDGCITAWGRALKAGSGSFVRHVIQPTHLPTGQVAVVETTRDETVLLTEKGGKVVAHECEEYYTVMVTGPDGGFVWSGHVAETTEENRPWRVLLSLVAPSAPEGTRVVLEPAWNPLPDGRGWTWVKTGDGWAYCGWTFIDTKMEGAYASDQLNS